MNMIEDYQPECRHQWGTLVVALVPDKHSIYSKPIYYRTAKSCMACGDLATGWLLPYWNMEKVEEHNKQALNKNPWS